MKNGCATGNVHRFGALQQIAERLFCADEREKMTSSGSEDAAQGLCVCVRWLYLTRLMKYILITSCMFAAKGKNYIIVNFSSINIFFLSHFTYLSTSALIDLAATGRTMPKDF